MNDNNILKQIILIVFSITLFCCSGGDDDTMDIPNSGNENEDKFEGQDDQTENKLTAYIPCTEWGKSIVSIKQKMADYILMEAVSYSYFPNNDYLVFTSKDKNCIISYGFMHDKLYVTNLFVRQDFASSTEIASFFKDYTKMDTDNGEFYLNKSTNTLGNVEMVSEMDSGIEYKYKSISWCDYNFEALEDKQAVDLGLSVKWATCNIGAQLPEERGNYYAWGETSAKDRYDMDNYLYYKWGDYVNIGFDISGTKYDAATQNWGASWRMPTKEELTELWEKCTWTALETYGGEYPYGGEFYGYQVTGPNGNKIFIPANNILNGTEFQCGCLDRHDFHTVALRGSTDGVVLRYSGGYSRIDNSTMESVGLGIRPVTDK